MARKHFRSLTIAGGLLLAAAGAMPAGAQIANLDIEDNIHAGEVQVPVNKSQVIRSDRAYTKALIGNPEVADVLPLTSRSLYVLGKKSGTTSLTLYDANNQLIAVIDVVVGPDVISLRRQLSELLPSDEIGARISNDSIVLEGIVSSGPTADRAVQLAETYAPGKVVNLLSVGSSQQVMLEVRFSEVKRSAAKQFGIGAFVNGNDANSFGGVFGGGSGSRSISDSNGDVTRSFSRDPITGSFGVLGRVFKLFGGDVNATLDALERKGVITTLAEPTLVALSGETASFLAGGEFPVPVIQSGGGGGTGNNNNGSSLTVEFKPFGVSLAFTPTVLADGVINMVVAPEVSSIDPTASVVINGLTIPGLQTRRAKTVVELRDGESFALAGLLRKDFQDTVRQFPVLGSIPIIGTLFRSTGFQKEETELVIVVTPRLVRPVPAGALKVPTDRVKPPLEPDLFINGQTDTGVPAGFGAYTLPPAASALPPPPPLPPPPLAPGGTAQRGPIGFEKDYGHVL